MQYDLQAQAQPFVKLAQANMELFTRFSSSPEVSAQVTASTTQLYQQAVESSMNLMRSGAFMNLVQGMIKNYTEFLMEFNQSAMTAVSQGQTALVQQVQEATDSVAEVTEMRGRRAR